MGAYTVHFLVKAEDDRSALEQAAEIRRLAKTTLGLSVPLAEVTDADDWSEHVNLMCSAMCGGPADDRLRSGGMRWCRTCMEESGVSPYPIPKDD